MSIDVTCSCGQVLTAPNSFAGKYFQCPYCDDRVPVPAAKSADAPTTPTASPAPAPVEAKPWQKSASKTASPERATQTQSGGSLESRVFNSGVLGGLLAMLIALVWFIVGLAADRIFFYPPILFIIGLVAFIKGLTQGPEQSE